MTTTPERADKIIESVCNTIDEHGLCVMYIFGDEGESNFAYTVGLSDHAHPELFIRGLPQQVAHGVLNAVGRDIRETGLVLQPGLTITGYLDGGYPLCPALMTENEAYTAQRLYGSDVEVLQLVMPDMSTNWPWEPGYGYSQAVQGQHFIRPAVVA